jgi:hypothetical protein
MRRGLGGFGVKKAPTIVVGAAMKRMEKLLLDSKSFFLKY